MYDDYRVLKLSPLSLTTLDVLHPVEKSRCFSGLDISLFVFVLIQFSALLDLGFSWLNQPLPRLPRLYFAPQPS